MKIKYEKELSRLSHYILAQQYSSTYNVCCPLDLRHLYALPLVMVACALLSLMSTWHVKLPVQVQLSYNSE